MNWLKLEGKVVIVTGGALGIGQACCHGLAECGAHVTVADFNEDAGKGTVKELTEKWGGKHLFVHCNVADKTSVENVVSTTLDTFGSIDVLVNNAGILIPRLLVDPDGVEELTEDILDKMLAVNIKGFFLFGQAAARAMMHSKKGGVIINMASESGLEGSQGQSVYAATKAAGYSVTRSWAKEMGTRNIRVVGLAPGILEATPLRNDEYERAVAYTRGITVEQLRASYEKVSIPLGRPGKLSEVADAVCFLASDRSSYMHGTTLNLSGGKSRA